MNFSINIYPMPVFLFDEICNRANILDNVYLKNKSYAILDDDKCRKAINISNTCGEDIDSEILKIFGLEKGGIGEYDHRIRKALDIINEAETIETGIIGLLCSKVFLSESRLSHLFREQIGTSIASYIMFSKLAKAYGYIRSGENITQASVHAGFSSSSHFASVNKKLFGISVKELGVVQKLFKTAEK